MRNISCLAKALFFRTMRQVFPTAKASRIREEGVRKHVFVGITSTEETISDKCESFLSIIQSDLPTDCIVLSKTDAYVKIGVMSYILSNGNQVFKEITFNLITKNWNLRVRGVTVNLYNLGLSNKFDFTVKSMEDIVYIVKRLKICKGLIVNNKKKLFPSILLLKFYKKYYKITKKVKELIKVCAAEPV